MLSIMENQAGEQSQTEEPGSMSRTLVVDPMPTDFFSRQALELTFRVLRNNHPLLANAIKQTLDTTPNVPYEELQSAYTGEMLLNVQVLNSLKAHTIGKIVSVLTEIGETALRDKNLPPGHMTLLRTLIEDWVQLTEWVLQRTTADQTDYLSITKH